VTGCFVLDTLGRDVYGSTEVTWQCGHLHRSGPQSAAARPWRQRPHSGMIGGSVIGGRCHGAVLYLAPGQPRLTRGAASEPRAWAVARLMPHLARARGWQGQSAGGGGSGPQWARGEGKFELRVRLAFGACADLGAASCSCGRRGLAGRASGCEAACPPGIATKHASRKLQALRCPPRAAGGPGAVRRGPFSRISSTSASGAWHVAPWCLGAGPGYRDRF
jgi:hypothetical protein